MGFIDKIKEFSTGKTATEREQERLFEARLKKEVMNAEQKERKIQSIRLAKESVRARADAKIRKVKSQYAPKQLMNFFGNMNYGSPFGQPRYLTTRKVITRKGKIKKRVSVPSYNIREQIKPQKYNVLGW